MILKPGNMFLLWLLHLSRGYDVSKFIWTVLPAVESLIPVFMHNPLLLEGD